MNTIYTKSKAWRVGLMTALSALLLFCGTATFAQTTYGPYSASPALAVPDGSYNGTLASMGASGIAVSGVTGTTVTDISVNVNMNHTWVGDLTIKLGAPDGSILTLTSRPGYAETVDDGTGCCGTSADWLGSTLTYTDAGATDGELLNTPFTGTYFPNAGATASVGSFGALFGGTMNGTWTLYVGDSETADLGTLNGWSINFVTASPSFTLAKTVAVEGGNGDCSDDVISVTDNISINAGDGVCYWYTATNTGDVAFDLIDFFDDQLLPGGLIGGAGLDLAVGSALAIPWDFVPTVINSTVTNIANITYYNSTLGLSAGPVSDVATVNTGVPAPSNDLCGNAISLSCGSSIVGTTVGATTTGNNVNLDCFELSGDLTVWYSFVGTGADIELSTCGPVTAGSGEAFIAVYDGSCGAFNCIVNNAASNPDPSCGTGLSQLVSFTSVQGVTYYISVASYLGGEIDFNLAVTCVCTADGGTTTAGSSPVCLTGGSAVVSATADGNQVVPVGYVTGYALTQSGIVQQVGASPSFTVTAAGTYVIHTFVYDPNTINPATAIGLPAATVNGLLIQGGGSICAGLDLAGASIVVQLCAPAPSNDLCGNAISLSCGSSIVGTTVGAGTIGNNVNLDCNELSDDLTVWYSFVGTGTDVELTTCGPVTAGSAEAFIAVYDGSCGAFNCIVNNAASNPDPSCGTGLSQLVSFTSVQGVTYYISVASYLGGEIDFNLAVTCVCTADGGTTTAGASPVCLTGGSAVVSATADGNQVVPVGYVTGYALTQSGIVQQVGASPSFTVTAGGTYIIHTFVYDPNTINPATAIGLPAATVNGLLIQGGGTICAGLDLTGASIVVDLCVSIAEAVENGMEVYPNPSNGQFVVEVRGVEADVQIIVTDLAGRQVYSEGVTINGSFRKELNLNVAKGSYLLQIATLDGSVTRKIFID